MYKWKKLFFNFSLSLIYLGINAYIKSVLKPVKENSESIKFICGTITDGNYQLELRLFNIDNMNIFNDFGKGDKVDITGNIVFNSKYI